MSYELRSLPPETVAGLRPPLAGFPYFAHAGNFPFESHADEYSAANAWWLADASLLVYGDEAFVESAWRGSPLGEQGFELEWLGLPSDNRGMVLRSEDTIVIVLRGTRQQLHELLDRAEVVLINQADLTINNQFPPTVAEEGGRVHAGFLEAFTEIVHHLDAIVQQRRASQAVWLAGHSLGGALATLAAAHLGSETVQGLYTFGCPRVGNAAFAATLPMKSHFRFIHRSDWVPNVPPQLLGYVHAGIVRMVTGTYQRGRWEEMLSSTATMADAVSTLATELKFQVNESPLGISSLIDHAPVFYATLLWNELVRGRARLEAGDVAE